MNKQKKLLLERSIFVFIITVILGIIVVIEKAGNIFIPRIEKKIDNYININYKELKNNIIKNPIQYKSTQYTMKISSKENKNYYFYIIYSNKTINDTYKEDYVQGKRYLQYITKKIKKEIQQKTNLSCKVSTISTLDNYTKMVQKRIIKEDNLLELSFYNIEKEIMIENWNEKEITKKISEMIKKFQNNNINPKNYTIIITNKENITESIKISNITNNLINNPLKEQIIHDIINDSNSKLLKDYKIKYKYLN